MYVDAVQCCASSHGDVSYPDKGLCSVEGGVGMSGGWGGDEWRVGWG